MNKIEVINKVHQQLIRTENSETEEIEQLMKITEGTWERVIINVHSVDKITYDNLITTVSLKYGDTNETFDNVNAKFDNNAEMQQIILAIHIGKDYSEFNKCIIGREKYAFDYWTIEYIYDCFSELLADMCQNPNLERLRIL